MVGFILLGFSLCFVRALSISNGRNDTKRLHAMILRADAIRIEPSGYNARNELSTITINTPAEIESFAQAFWFRAHSPFSTPFYCRCIPDWQVSLSYDGEVLGTLLIMSGGLFRADTLFDSDMRLNAKSAHELNSWFTEKSNGIG